MAGLKGVGPRDLSIGRGGEQPQVVPTWVYAKIPATSSGNLAINQAIARLGAGNPTGARELLEPLLESFEAGAPPEPGTDYPAMMNVLGVTYGRLAMASGNRAELDRSLGLFDSAISRGGADKYPNAVYNRGVTALKVAIHAKGLWDSYRDDRASVPLDRLDRGSVDQALNHLEQAANTAQDPDFFRAMARPPKGDADWAPLHRHPRFIELVRAPG